MGTIEHANKVTQQSNERVIYLCSTINSEPVPFKAYRHVLQGFF